MQIGTCQLTRELYRIWREFLTEHDVYDEIQNYLKTRNLLELTQEIISFLDH